MRARQGHQVQPFPCQTGPEGQQQPPFPCQACRGGSGDPWGIRMQAWVRERQGELRQWGMWEPGRSPLGRWSKPGDSPMYLVLDEVRREEGKAPGHYVTLMCWRIRSGELQEACILGVWMW